MSPVQVDPNKLFSVILAHSGASYIVLDMTPPAFAGTHQEREAPPLHRINTCGLRALLTDPWVFGSAWQGGSVSAEGEHGQCDECFRGAESERNPGQQADFGVGGFDQSLG